MSSLSQQCFEQLGPEFFDTIIFILSTGTAKSKQIVYCIFPKYWDTLSTYHTCPKIWNSPFYYILRCLKYYCMYGKKP